MSGNSNSQHLSWGILGGGNISRQFGAALATSAKGRLVRVATRSAIRSPPVEFACAQMVTGYDELLADVDVDATSIGLPHPFHAEWAIRAIEAKNMSCARSQSRST
jgi:predicted dehydrogenase